MDKILKALLVIFVIAGNIVVILAMAASRLELYIGGAIVALSLFFLLSMFLDSKKVKQEEDLYESLDYESSEEDSSEVLEYYKKQITQIDEDEEGEYTLTLPKEDLTLEEVTEELVEKSTSKQLVDSNDVIDKLPKEDEIIEEAVDEDTKAVDDFEEEIKEKKEWEEIELEEPKEDEPKLPDDEEAIEEPLGVEIDKSVFDEEDNGLTVKKPDDAFEDLLSLEDTVPIGDLHDSDNQDTERDNKVELELSDTSEDKDFSDTLKVDTKKINELVLEEASQKEDVIDIIELEISPNPPKLKQKEKIRTQEIVISLPEERNGRSIKYFRRKIDDSGQIRYHRIKELTLVLKAESNYQQTIDDLNKNNYQVISSEESYVYDDSKINKPVVSAKLDRLEEMDVAVMGEELDNLRLKGTSYYRVDSIEDYEDSEEIEDLPESLVVDEKNFMQLLLVILRKYDNEYYIVRDVALSELFVFSSEEDFDNEQVDFIIQDENEVPLIGIQLYSYLDTLKDKIFISTIFNKAKLPLLAFHEGSRYKVADIKSLITRILE
jgi:hypothetical protein